MKRVSSVRLAAAACGVLALGVAAPAAFSAASASPVVASSSASWVKVGDVQQAMENLAQVDGVVGTIGEVYVDGKRIGKGSAGSRLLDGKGGRIPSNARYRIGSQTKQMTATMVLQMVDEGRLSLDSRLSEVLPQVAEADLVEQADRITVRDLITMVSGIPDYYNGPGSVDSFDLTTAYTPTDLLKISRRMPRTGPIGAWSYSNTSYLLLGMIVERLSGRPLSAELDRRLFRPLGMKDSYLPTRPPQGVKGPHGHGYATDASGALHDMDRLNASTLLGVGGVVSTAHDTAAFQRAYQEGRLLPPDLQKVFENPAPGAPPAPDAGGVCQGKPSLTGHAGSAPGFVATTYTSPDGRIQFAVSMTVAGDGRQREAASRRVSEAVKTVFCPGT